MSDGLILLIFILVVIVLPAVGFLLIVDKVRSGKFVFKPQYWIATSNEKLKGFLASLFEDKKTLLLVILILILLFQVVGLSRELDALRDDMWSYSRYSSNVEDEVYDIESDLNSLERDIDNIGDEILDIKIELYDISDAISDLRY